MKGKMYYRKEMVRGFSLDSFAGHPCFVHDGRAGASRWIPLLGTLVLFMMVVPGLLAACGGPKGDSHRVKGQAPKVNKQDHKAHYVPSEVLVKFKDSMDRVQVDRLAADHNCRVEESVATINLYRMKILDKRDIWDVVSGFTKDPRVEYAEPNFIDHPTGAPPGDS